MTTGRIPRATYRLQLHGGFDFAAARAIVPYLHRLGISDLYLSPVFAARPGSTHGYDVTDPTVLNPELGGATEFAALLETVIAHGMGIVLDIVPNHMAAGPSNAWWTDVLEHGPQSRYGAFFDIAWEGTPGFPTHGRVLLPVLGAPLGDMLTRGDITVSHAGGRFAIAVYESRLPIAPRSLPLLLAQVSHTPGGQDAPLPELDDLMASAATLNDLTGDGYRRQAAEITGALEEFARAPRIASAFDAAAAMFTGELLEELLRQQWYVLTFWKLAPEHVNYRRFFDINDLVGVRVEVPDVFATTHALIADLAARPGITGLRVDHIDGLRDPAGYLRALHGTTVNADARAPYLVVEKILGQEEHLPSGWPIHGTTGYDFVNLVNGLFIDEAGVRAIGRWYGEHTTRSEPFPDMVLRGKRRAVHTLFPGVLRTLTDDLAHIARSDLRGHDITLSALGEALAELSISLPVYRLYVDAEGISATDRDWLTTAVGSAAARCDATALAFLTAVITLDGFAGGQCDRALDFVLRWQQFTGPLMAKGLEDTALYRDARLVAVNTVGRDPLLDWPVVSPQEFHHAIAAQASQWPHTMRASSTHDTKRSEDVRSRLNALSELAGSWMDAAVRWRELNEPHRRQVDTRIAPSIEEELFLYQTIAGAWPLETGPDEAFVARIREYMTKAMREARLTTSWTSPDEPYESAVMGFIDACFAPEQSATFREDVASIARRLAWYGAINSLAEAAIKATVPGVPDYYQGTETWNLRLVDPDNRRPVDFETLTGMLTEVEGDVAFADLLTNWADGRVKLFCTTRLLALRREHEALLTAGTYIPIEVQGAASEHVIAFAREHGGDWLVTVVPRLVTRIALPGQPPCGEAVWGDTRLLLPPNAPTRWRETFTGTVLDTRDDGEGGQAVLSLAQVLANGPVAILTTEE